MSVREQLEAYEEWKATRGTVARDLSPEAFEIDQAKEQALEKLIKIADRMDAFYEEDWHDTDAYERACTRLHDDIVTILND